MSDDLREQIARAVRKNRMKRTGAGNAYDASVQPTESELLDADAALTAIEASGFAVVPDDIYNALAASRNYVWAEQQRLLKIDVEYAHDWAGPRLAAVNADLAKIDAVLDGTDAAERREHCPCEQCARDKSR